MRFIQAKHCRRAQRGPRDVTLVVLHSMEYPERVKSAEWCAQFFTDPRGPNGPVTASAHYNVDAEEIVQSVLEKDVAWHAGPVNEYAIGIEHAGYAAQTDAQWRDAYSARMLDRSAKLVADICKRYRIPLVRLTGADLAAGQRHGICGHVDVTNGLQGGKGHTDPGQFFPWGWYLERVRIHAGSSPTLPAANGLVTIEHEGQQWQVYPFHIAPVGIGEASRVVAEMGFELPSPGLVDAIWRAADLKINGWDIANAAAGHDGTAATMNSDATHAKVLAKVVELIGDRGLGVDYNLIAGTFKDVVVQDGKIGLYGWHDANGKPIQGYGPDGKVFTGHSPAWKDYSQGVRPVRRVG